VTKYHKNLVLYFINVDNYNSIFSFKILFVWNMYIFKFTPRPQLIKFEYMALEVIFFTEKVAFYLKFNGLFVMCVMENSSFCLNIGFLKRIRLIRSIIFRFFGHFGGFRRI